MSRKLWRGVSLVEHVSGSPQSPQSPQALTLEGDVENEANILERIGKRSMRCVSPDFGPGIGSGGRANTRYGK